MIKPIGSRVTIQSLEIAETKSASGLILPSSNNLSTDIPRDIPFVNFLNRVL